jgi:hypothetical protein
LSAKKSFQFGLGTSYSWKDNNAILQQNCAFGALITIWCSLLLTINGAFVLIYIFKISALCSFKFSALVWFFIWVVSKKVSARDHGHIKNIFSMHVQNWYVPWLGSSPFRFRFHSPYNLQDYWRHKWKRRRALERLSHFPRGKQNQARMLILRLTKTGKKGENIVNKVKSRLKINLMVLSLPCL